MKPVGHNKIAIAGTLHKPLTSTKFHSSIHVTDRHLPIITVKSQMNYLWLDGDDGDDCDRKIGI
jgi:hypothetical protein